MMRGISPLYGMPGGADDHSGRGNVETGAGGLAGPPFSEGIVFSVAPKKSWKNICNLSGER